MDLPRLFPFLLANFLALCCISKSQSLFRPDSCADYLEYFKTNALSRVGPYGLSRPRFARTFTSQPTLQSASLSSEAPAAPVAGTDFSETNVQVAGVDEPDIVKTDGTRVFALRRNLFYVVKVEGDGASGTIVGNLTLPSSASEMLVQDDTVLVVGTVFSRVPQPRPINNFARNSFFFFPQLTITETVIYKIDVARSMPQIIGTLRVPGRYMNGREVDGIARILIKTNLGNGLGFRFPGLGLSTFNATKFNEDVIRNTTAEDWLPTYTLEEDRCRGRQTASGGCKTITTGHVVSCRDVFLTTDVFTGFSLLTVLTVSLRGSFTPRKSVSIASDGDEVFSTATSLYVTSNQYRFDFPFSSIRWGSTFRTTLHKFRLMASGSRYVASGQVTGSVLNQFSMHEFQDRFFVATTEGATWWTGRNPSRSKVSSFEVRGRRLVQIGEVGNLGIGERIFAVRYIRSTAYVVTFRQIDPLYIIDLSNPANLVVTGELKIPGFSSYLHPIAPGRILGVGREATPEGRIVGAKVTLFDVSDVESPREVAKWILPGGFSRAEFDHRAFLYWDPASTAVIPLSVFSRNRSEAFSGSVVLEVTSTGIVERGRIIHRVCCTSFSSGVAIERNFVIGRVHLWSLSRSMLQVNRIDSLTLEDKISFQ